jgi:hypothetical protein
MKITVIRPVEIDVAFIEMTLPIRYGEEDMPNDFPLRTGDVWQAVVDISTGIIIGWPIGTTGEFNLKVDDDGVYLLIDADGNEIARREDYVPDVISRDFANNVHLIIDANGVITNWPKEKDIDLSDLFKGD